MKIEILRNAVFVPGKDGETTKLEGSVDVDASIANKLINRKLAKVPGKTAKVEVEKEDK